MMAYLNNYVVSIIHKGKPQREFGSDGERTVELPFNSEYSIRVKNSTNTRALVEVSIDGMSIFSGSKTLILEPRRTVDLERFVDDLREGAKFKFVSKLMAEGSGHSDPTSSDFGIVTVNFIPELEFSSSLTSHFTTSTPLLGSPFSLDRVSCVTFPGSGPQAMVNQHFASNSATSNAVNLTTAVAQADSSVGGTIEGSRSGQEFTVNHSFIAWNYQKKSTIGIRLKGPSDKVRAPYRELATSIRDESGVTYTYQWSTKNPDGSIMVVYK